MKKKLSVEGMSCGHCVQHVTDALMEIQGVEKVSVDLAGKSAMVDLSAAVDNETLMAAVEDAGYEVTAVQNA